MKRFGINRERRVDHCLMFDRKTTNTLSPSQRTAMFQTNQSDLSHAAGMQGELCRGDDQTESMFLARRLFKANQHDYERTDGMAISLETTPRGGHSAKKAERGMQRN